MNCLNFSAIDFETANARDTSACSIGIAVVEDGVIRETQHYLIKPYPNYFHPVNVRIHGIQYSDVQGAPTFGELWPTIRPFLEGRVIAAHYAPFDMGILLGGLDFYDVPRPDLDVLCSCRMSRMAFPELRSHKLDIVCGYLNIPLSHHRADSDAEGCAQIIIEIAKRIRLRSLMDVRKKLRLEPGSVRDGVYVPLKKWS